MLTFACGLLLAVLPQEPDLLMALLRCEVHGAKTFSAAAIHDAVSTDAAVLQKLQEHVDASAFAAAVAERVREGYLHAGFGEAKVDAALRDGVLDLEIREGQRLACGEVHVEGNAEVPTLTILAALLELSEPDRWSPDTPAKLDQKALAAVAAQVRACYARLGRHGVQCKVTSVPDGAKARLQIAVTDEGQEVHLGRLELVGERASDVAAVLQHIPYQEGALYTFAFAADLRRRIEALGRYVHVVLPRGEDAIGGGLDPCRVQVQLTEFAPAAATTNWEDLAQVQRGLDWLQQVLRAGRAVRVEALPAAGERIAMAAAGLSCTRILAHVAADGGTLLVEGLRYQDQPMPALRLCMRRNQVLLAMLPEHFGWLQSDGLVQVQTMVANLPRGREMELRWGLTLQPSHGNSLDMELHPTTATYLLQHPGLQWRREARDLIATSREGSVASLRFAADGTMACNFVDDRGSGRTSVTLADTNLEPIVQAMRPASGRQIGPLDELAALLADQAGRMLAGSPGGKEPCMALARATARFAASAVRSDAPAKTPEADFAIPVVSGGPSGRSSEANMPLLVALRLANGCKAPGWPRALLGDLAAMLLLGRSRAEAARSVFALAKADAAGPLARWLAARALALVGYQEAAEQLGPLVLQACTVEAMWRDILTLSDAVEVRPGLRALGAFWRQQPELQALFADLKGEDADELALQRGFEQFWNAGLGEAVRGLLAAGK